MISYKKEILDKFAKRTFPAEKINEDALKVKEILFSEKRQDFELHQKIDPNAYLVSNDPQRFKKPFQNKNEWKREKKEETNKKDDFFEKISPFLKENSADLDIKSNTNVNVNANSIEVLQQVNDYLGLNENVNLWYLRHPLINAQVGPFTTNTIEEMFKNQVISNENSIKLIECFSLRKSEDITTAEPFYKLKEILSNIQNFLDNVHLNPIIEAFQKKISFNESKAEFLKEKTETPVHNFSTINERDNNEDEFVQVKKNKKPSSSNAKKSVFDDKSIIGARKVAEEKTGKTFIDDEFSTSEAKKPKKAKFNTKGKPVEATFNFVYK